MIAITFYIFIHIDIRRHLQTQRLEELACEEENAALADISRDFHARVSSKTSVPLNLRYGQDPASHDTRFEELVEEASAYRFNTGRHAGSLYLKLGAVGKYNLLQLRLSCLYSITYLHTLYSSLLTLL